jgi:hypothetical protein
MPAGDPGVEIVNRIRSVRWLTVLFTFAAAAACSPGQAHVNAEVEPAPFQLVKGPNYVGAIVPAKLAAGDFPPPILPIPTKFWTPNADDIATAERAIRSNLELALEDRRQLRILAGPRGNSPDWESPELARALDRVSDDIHDVLGHYQDYSRQYVGFVASGHQWVWCSFFPRSDVDLQSRMFVEYVEVVDGGDWFWRIECEPQTGKCVGFGTNGN